MALLKIKLSRNLRRSILRGHPWIYKDAVILPKAISQATLCQISDTKGEIAWGFYDPHSPLTLRVLSFERAPPAQTFFESRFKLALELRNPIRTQQTNAYRLFNGEGDLLPGLVCDVYDRTAVMQFDGQGPSEFWDRNLLTQWLIANAQVSCVVEKKRRNAENSETSAIEILASDKFENEVIIKENGALFQVNLEKGQKTGFFLDQRDNRNYLRATSAGKKVLNLFSYSGGFSINAGLGGASKVTSVDISQGAIELADLNWQLNKLHLSEHVGITADVFKFLADSQETWDQVIVDPPSMSHSENQKEAAKQKYIETFSVAAKRVAAKGELFLSSCSSHISFEDFFEIINESLSAARRRGRILRISGQGSDHPFPHFCHELRYLKFVHLALE